MATGPQKQPVPEGDLAVVPERKVQRARRYSVVFYNDDYTTKWFVVDVLMTYFHMTETTAMTFMIEVHETGRGIAGVYTRDIAETKVAEVMAHAKEYEMPLRLDVEPEDDGSD